jgi:hypothetical protein
MIEESGSREEEEGIVRNAGAKERKVENDKRAPLKGRKRK